MTITTILYAILMFSVLIFVHEFGHFILAKINGVKVLNNTFIRLMKYWNTMG